MILKQELIKKHRALHLPLPTIEKDYILGLVLFCLYRHPYIKERWIFKGGTCLKKIYFQDYRFSEDLDFSLTKEASVDPQEIETHLLEAFSIGQNLFGLHIDKTNIQIKPFPDQEGLFIQIKVPFQSPLMTSGSLPKIKLDLSKNELLVDTPCFKSLLHDYTDANNVSTPILCYSLEEIFSEKCRAFTERTRPRDLYDIIHLYERFFDRYEKWDHLLNIIRQKFQFRSLSFPHDFINIPQSQFAEAQEAWLYMLSHQIHPLGMIEEYLEKLRLIKEKFTQIATE